MSTRTAWHENTREAERTILGGMMSDPGIIPEVASRLDGVAFGSEKHTELFDLVLKMSDKGEPTDTMSVVTRIQDADRADSYGGLMYVSSLEDDVVSTANIAHYVGRVSDAHLARKLRGRCRDAIVAIDDNEMDKAQDLMAFQDGEASSSDVKSFNEVMRTIIDEDLPRRMDARRTGKSTGIPFPYKAMAPWVPEAGEFYIIAARPGMGKAQPLTEPVLTPGGYVQMGDISVGDLVVGDDGFPKRVLGVYPQGVKKVFRVNFSDETWARCCDDHLWKTSTRDERRYLNSPDWSVKPLSQIRKTIRRVDGGNRNHAIPVAKAAYLRSTGRLPVDPYLLGVLIGDGGLKRSSIVLTQSEGDILDRAEKLLPEGDSAVRTKEGLRIIRRHTSQGSATKNAIVNFGLNKKSIHKHIPEPYLTASAADRELLLQGLHDTDGYVTGPGRMVEYSTSSPDLADGYRRLVESLGGRTKLIVRKAPKYRYRGEVRAGAPSYRFASTFYDPSITPVSSEKHLAKWQGAPKSRFTIVSVDEDGEEECQCIQVEGGLYLTRNAVVTHNTAFAAECCRMAAHRGVGSAQFQLEMPDIGVGYRMLCAEARLSSWNARKGIVDDDQYGRMADAAEVVAGLPLWIDDRPRQTVEAISRKARRLKQRHPEIGIISIDYIQLMGESLSDRNRTENVGHISQGLKSLAKELEVSVFGLSQLNRSVESRQDKRPQMSDLRDSGSLEQDADGILFLYRPGYYDETDTSQIVEVKISKWRSGESGKTVELQWCPETIWFADRPNDSDAPWRNPEYA
jgi:replicative DNA helicase